MALWVCKRCGCNFAVGLSMCPQCTGTDIEDEMPKTTLSGPNVGADQPPIDYGVEQWPDQDGVLQSVPTEEGERSSVGISSLTPSSSQQTETSEETSSKRKSAPTTESPSKKGHTGSSTARSTGTARKTDK